MVARAEGSTIVSDCAGYPLAPGTIRAIVEAAARQRACAVAELDTRSRALAINASAATALRVLRAVLPLALTPNRGGRCLTDAD